MRIGDLVRYQEGWLPTTEDWEQFPFLVGPTGAVIAMTLDHEGRTTSATVRWLTGEVETLTASTSESDAVRHCRDLYVVTPLLYANVYLEDRAYGGPEEGGWWYNTLDLVQSLLCRTPGEAEEKRDELLKWCAAENADRRSDISSVCSEGRYVVYLEAWPGEPSPLGKPHYC